MFVFVDYRETWFFNFAHNDDAPVKPANLPIGDFVISNSDDVDDILYIIERKTWKDLLASITDGRFRQQKDRLMSSVKDPNKIVYIIEGTKSQLRTPMNHRIADSAIQNLVLKHKFKVFFSESQSNTHDQIKLLHKKLKNKELLDNTPVCPIKLQSRKQSVMTNIFATQLSAIPGLSYKSAVVISEKYKNMKGLFTAYVECTDDKSRHELLCSIQASPKRCLGKSLSTKIYKVLMGDEVQTDECHSFQDQVQCL